MAQLCTPCDSGHFLLLSLLYGNFLSVVFFLCSNPLHLAFLLYFSPYILQLLSFLFPLLLTTSIPLLLLSTHCILEDEAAAARILEQLGSMIVATIGNVFEWEFEAMGELYKNVGLICEVEDEDQAEICVEKSAKTGLLPSNSESGDQRVTMKGSSFEPEDPRGSIGELDKHFVVNSEVGGEQMELSLKISEKSELSELHFGIENDRFVLKSSSFEPETPDNHRKSMRDPYDISSLNCDGNEDPTVLSSEKSERSEIAELHPEIGYQANLRVCGFVPQTPDRISEILVNSPLARRARQRAGGLESFSRSGSMRSGSMRIPAEFYKHSSLNRQVAEGPDETFFKSSEKIEQLKPQSEEGGSFKSRNLSGMQENLKNSPSIRSKDEEGRAIEGLQREGSMRKDREWKRTLACKLYEERMTVKLGEERTVVDGAEEMDLLWEEHETDADKSNKVKNGGKKGACIEEEDDEQVGQFCCLQALSISTGKMNVGRHNLARAAKVFKGIGIFHRSSSSRSRKE